VSFLYVWTMGKSTGGYCRSFCIISGGTIRSWKTVFGVSRSPSGAGRRNSDGQAMSFDLTLVAGKQREKDGKSRAVMSGHSGACIV
jgi:hypothetical protein